ncbi:MAG: tryptophan 2,3-dioxygenase [Saprospiraceae bacterium]|nr:MAG: tryptophan 2,3-dioxygenase [Saprospiraceae bacterium]
MKLTHEMLDRLDKLEEKYAVMGQDMSSYLDGLLYNDYLTYWDYIHLDTLLSLQNPRTSLPDEQIFIMYHQITELYFKLTIKAIEQLIKAPTLTVELFKRQMNRVIRYIEHLIDSFDVMIDGMDRDEFLKFRMSLLPASGFQSGQYRKIEILSTDLYHLVHHSKRAEIDANTDFETAYEHLYWKSGATELATGRKTLTLKQFEKKYSTEFITLAETVKSTNLWQTYLKLDEKDREDEDVIRLMREYDFSTNVRWPLMHFKSAVRYLDQKPDIIKATGGTNWQKYLPPIHQRIIFYPELWTKEELDKWGRKVKM